MTAVSPQGLSVEGLSAGYGRSLVIENLSLSVGPGEIVALLGPNGAGKTTTLMSIAGFIPGTTGHVQVGGQHLGKEAPQRRMRTSLGLVLEGRSVIPSLTVEQNLRLGEVDIDEAIGMFPALAKCRKRRAGMLSGGEQQMVSLVRAMCRRPAALLIDELSLGLSPIACERLFAVLRAYASERRMAVLLVEQHLQYAASVSERALIMTGGAFALELPSGQLHARAAEIEQLYVGTNLT
jgi:branched-chain amino acid transport system ATP-binding protein